MPGCRTSLHRCAPSWSAGSFGWCAKVDFHWPAHGLVVEADGRATHGTDQAFEADRRRDLYLRLAGWDVMRFTWRQVTGDADRVAAALRARLTPRKA